MNSFDTPKILNVQLNVTCCTWHAQCLGHLLTSSDSSAGYWIFSILLDSVFNIWWEPQSPYQRFCWTHRAFLPWSCPLKVWHTLRDILDRQDENLTCKWYLNWLAWNGEPCTPMLTANHWLWVLTNDWLTWSGSVWSVNLLLAFPSSVSLGFGSFHPMTHLGRSVMSQNYLLCSLYSDIFMILLQEFGSYRSTFCCMLDLKIMNQIILFFLQNNNNFVRNWR